MSRRRSTRFAAACPGIPIGIGTGAWIIPDLRQRLSVIRSWSTLPDFASVNLHEAGAAQVIELLLERGVGVEAGIWNAPAAVSLVRSGLARPLSADSAGTGGSVVQRASESAADGRRADRRRRHRGCCTGSDTARGICRNGREARLRHAHRIRRHAEAAGWIDWQRSNAELVRAARGIILKAQDLSREMRLSHAE